MNGARAAQRSLTTPDLYTLFTPALHGARSPDYPRLPFEKVKGEGVEKE